MSAKPFRFRGPKAFYQARKRHKLDGLRSRMAEYRTTHPGGGGTWHGKTGDGEAWSRTGDHYIFGWFQVRQIRGGQWRGPWCRKRIREV